MNTARVSDYGGMMLAVVKAKADTTAVLLTETGCPDGSFGSSLF
jgi:hypothetical protein